MRTSLSQQIQGSLGFINTASNKLAEAQNRAITGKRILRCSDDIAGTSQAMSLRTSISNTEQYANNIIVSKPLLSSTMNAVAQMTKCVRTVRDLALQAAEPDFSGSTAQTINSQLEGILAQMKDIANTKQSDQYIFSGLTTNISPVSETAAGFAYNGDSGQRTTQVMPWMSLPTSIPGDKVFNFDGSAGTDSTDVFTMVKNLEVAILTGKVATISNELKNIDANYGNLTASSAKLGSWSQRMTAATTTLTETQDRLKTMLSDTEDVDLPQAIVDLKTQENIYSVTLAVTDKVLNMSLASQNRV